MATTTPKYLALYQQLKAEILSNKYPTGSFLPVEEKLVEMYDASRTTVRHAISLLKADGLLDVKQGRGTEVLPVASSPNDFRKFRNANQIAARFLMDGEYTINAVGSVVDTVNANAVVARALKLDIGQQVYRLQKIQTLNEIPFAFMVHYLRCDMLPNLEQHSGKIFNFASFVTKEYGISIDHTEETISAVSASFVASRMLNVEDGSPLLAFYRVSSCDGSPLEYGETVIRPDKFEIVVTMNGNASFLEEQQKEMK